MKGILARQSSSARRRARAQSRLFIRRSPGRALAPAQTTQPSSPVAAPRTEASGSEQLSHCDAAARRVRAAGGPTDEASYTCACGCVFAAPVSASVACPNCGAEQDW
jgi:hypothetical protein